MQTTGKEEISLYFHIPFCTQKCPYCHFYVLPNCPSWHTLLLDGFSAELELWRQALQNCSLATLYFGGGTPSLLDPLALQQILQRVQKILPFSSKEIEITLEANPESLTPEKAAAWADLGINRLSIGMQSLDDALLHKLGRTHHAAKALLAIETAAQSGIQNLSIDLMYEVPGQTLHSWSKSLARLANMPITHLSLYNLTIEPGTLFFKYRDHLLKELPDPESGQQMYEMAIQQLGTYGLHQYEISAFARPGFQARHNMGYWTGRPFLGFGPSAFSYWQGKRFRNKANLQHYASALQQGLSPVDFSEELAHDARQRELFTIALRLLAGVDLAAFTQQHGPLDRALLAQIEKLTQLELLQRKGERISLTSKGIFIYDTIAAELI